MDFQSAVQFTSQALKNAFKGVSDEAQLGLQNCTTCAQVCEQLISHCLSMGGAHAAEKHIRLLIDCANICSTSARFIVRGSDFYSRICSVCAEVCLECAEDCERFGDDEMMKNCAEVCRRCAESCQKLTTRH